MVLSVCVISEFRVVIAALVMATKSVDEYVRITSSYRMLE